MRYILDYKLFEDKNVIIDQTIKEICYDITDYGYNVDFFDRYAFNSNTEIELSCEIKKTIKETNYREWFPEIPVFTYVTIFKFDDIKETILRIIDYLGDRFIYIELIQQYPLGSIKNFNKKFYEINEIFNMKLIKIVIRYK